MNCGEADCEGFDVCRCRTGVVRSDLLMGLMPSLYVSSDINNIMVCTHRLSKTDIPIYCKNIGDASFIMDLVWKAREANDISKTKRKEIS